MSTLIKSIIANFEAFPHTKASNIRSLGFRIELFTGTPLKFELIAPDGKEFLAANTSDGKVSLSCRASEGKYVSVELGEIINGAYFAHQHPVIKVG
jgi:hypothetical protein